MSTVRVFVDANVFVDFHARHLLLTAADRQLIEVCWSNRILAETRRTMITKLGHDANKVDRMLNVVNTAFAESLIKGYEHIEPELALPDPDDRHVVAAALHSQCECIATQNLKDFPSSELARLGIQAASLDEVLARLLRERQDEMLSTVRFVQEHLTKPPVTIASYLDVLGHPNRAPKTARSIRELLRQTDSR